MSVPLRTDEDWCKVVAGLVKECEQYRTDQSVDRVRAMEYYDGTMRDTPSDEGRSKVVSRDVRGEIKKVLPSIARVILGGDKVVEYQPVKEGDEQTAQQATDYVNYLAFPESQGPDAVHDAIDDALRLRNGILKWWQEVKFETSESVHTGLDDGSFAQLVADDEITVLEHTEQPETIEGENVTLHDVRIRRKVKKSRSKMAAVALDNFLIHPDALCLEDSPIIGEGYRIRRSDLIAMGYDRGTIESLPIAGSARDQDEEETTRRRDIYRRGDATAKSLEEIEYYELLVRLDYDDDGIAELRRMVFAGGLTENFLLENEPWDEINYADIVCERRPHQWEGNSVTDDVAEIQRIKTVLLRQTLDNLYWQNNQQPIVQEGSVENPEAVTNPAFGLPIRVKSGLDVRAALGFAQVPVVADKSFQMLAYLDTEKQDRTGISDASGGLPPDALQNVTAKASAMIEQAGIGQTEMMVRTIAQCLKPAFRGLLKLIVQHTDIPRTVRLRGQWVQFDPRTWNVDMDVSVNTGLGAGTRERDLMMMNIVTGIQEKLLAVFGADGNPYVKPEQLYNGIAKTVEASGLKSVHQYFSNPTPEEMQALANAKAQQPSPEHVKINGQKEIEGIKGQVQLALKDKDIQKEASKEREQRDADLVIKQAELEKESQSREHEALLEQQRSADQMVLEREKIASNERIKFAELAMKADLEREKMDREDKRAELQRQNDNERLAFETANREAVQ